MLEFSSDKFTWSNRSGCTEASDLGLAVGERAPANFAIVSERTGARREFYRQSARVFSDFNRYVTFDNLPQLAVSIFND